MARAAHAWPFGIINLFGARKPGPCSAKVAELREVAGAGPQASSYSQNDVAGTMQRFASPTRRWCTAYPDLDRFRPKARVLDLDPVRAECAGKLP